MRVCGTYKPDAHYDHLDVVMKDSSSFVALKDAPGVCPGADWQMRAASGRRGVAGEKGERGERGAKGDPGIKITGWKMDRKNYRLTVTMSDGTEQPIELRELFEQFHSEAR